METSSPQQLVYQALQFACSQDPALLKPAEQKLSEWEIEPGFYSTLLSIFSNHQVDANVRWMAVVYFKNGINKYWRKNTTNEIQATEKTQIRTQLISSFNEPVPQIAIQIAALIAKIARLDCPKEWPELVPVLLEAVRSQDSLQQHRALLVLHQVIKALSSKRMLPDKKAFEQLTSNLYSFILNLWDGFTTLFFQSVQENSTQIELSINYLEKALLSLRILRKLTIYGIHKPHVSENCMLFLNAIFRRLKECLELRYQFKQHQQQQHHQNQQQHQFTDKIIELLEKFILKQTKLLNEFLEQHPLSFINHITTALEFSFNYVFHHGITLIYDNNTINFTHFAIQCINLMKGILSSVAYNSPMASSIPPSTTINLNQTEIMNNITINNGDINNCSGSSNNSNNGIDGCNKNTSLIAKRNFFTNERLSYICERIITHYFILTQSDLDLWIDDPESFASDEGGESWKYSLRPCTETFFLTLFAYFKQEMIKETLKYVRKAQEMILTPDSDLKDILLKDAIYTATGLVAFHFYDEIDFDTWFTHQLLNEIKISTDNFRIIRRKAIWLIGQWTSVKFSKNLRPKVYETCLELLQPQEDMSVRLAASKALMSTIDDFEFESEPFLPYLEPCFSTLFVLLKEAKECDTKMNVLCIMSSIVDKMSDNIQPQAENLITYLPLLWKESEDHNMLRCAIISTLLQIVRAICDVPQTLLPFLYIVIQISTDIKNSSSVYLMEEGLELWLAVVQNIKQITPELLDLCSNLISIIEMSSENLRTVLYIIQAYVILNPDIYLQRYGKTVISTCAYLLNDMRQEGMVMVLKLFEVFLKALPNYGIELIKPVLPFVFKKVCKDEDYIMTMAMYLTIVSRVLLINQQIFIETLQETNLLRALETILDIWLAKMPSIRQTEERKLMSLALGSILTVDNTILHERFPVILQNICETLNDVMCENEEGHLEESLLFADENEFDASNMCTVEDFEYKTYHYERTRQICLKDPVHRISLKEYIQSQLSTLKQNLGDQRYQSLMLTVDPSILSELAEYINVLIEIPKSE